ncbi:MAG: DegT/DnrJ/EryC1/StrS family aminotransferase [Armatimonadota bacterium]
MAAKTLGPTSIRTSSTSTGITARDAVAQDDNAPRALYPFIPFYRADVGPDEIAAVVECLQSGWITTGPLAHKLEHDVASAVGAAYAVAVNSCTAALHLALNVLGVGPGDEVITTPMTFCSTAEVIEYLGAKPVFADIDPDTLNISPKAVSKAITDRTKVIMPVHYGGHPCDMDEIMAIAQDAGANVVEDAAHAIGASYRGRPIGSIGDITCFSFYATKNVTTAEGGMLVTNNQEWADHARRLSLHGIDRDAWKRYRRDGSWEYDVVDLGFKYNLPDVLAAIGLAQLQRLEEANAVRRAYAQMYDRAFAEVPELDVLNVRPYVTPSRHLYIILLHLDKLSIGRAEFIEQLKALNVGTSVHFKPVHLHSYYMEKYGFRKGDFPTAENAYERLISLPLYPGMTQGDLNHVIWAVKEIIARHRR